MTEATCDNCGTPAVEGRFNCPKCGASYPDIAERQLTWDPTKEEEKQDK
jgi:uncharacterized Zn finger protein (UPF0148 family)